MNQREFALEIVKRLQSQGFEALWAGGCVRDQLLGISPKDYDVATSAVPDQIREIFGRKRTLAIGAAFGVITVLGPRSAGQVEVATFRTDSGYSDGRHPDSVTFSNAEEDAKRRDFTINGLFFDPVQEQIIDYVGGETDLKKQIIRAIRDPYERITEDKLRMLRAVRFSATYGFEIEPDTLAAIKQMADQITVVSAERIGAELRRMLSGNCAGRAVQTLATTKLLEQTIKPTSAPDNWTETIRAAADSTATVLGHLSGDSDHAIAMGALLSEACQSPDQVIDICRAIKWSNDETDKTRWTFENIDTLTRAHTLPWSQLQPLLINKWSRDAVELVRAIQLAKRESLESYQLCLEKLDLPKNQLDPEPFISGDDLRRIGLPPSPAYKTILQSIRDRQLDGEIESAEAALDLAKKMAEEFKP